MLDLLSLFSQVHDKLDQLGVDNPQTAPLDPKAPLPVEVEAREKRLRALLNDTLENSSQAALAQYIHDGGEMRDVCEAILEKKRRAAEAKLAEKLAPEKHTQQPAPEETPT